MGVLQNNKVNNKMVESKNMKKAIWLAVLVVIVAVLAFFKFVYPNSQMQLKRSFRYAVAMPVEHFYNAQEKTCGIWYESQDKNGELVAGKSNSKVKKCFKESFDNCQRRNILLVDDLAQTKEKTVSYSLVRVLRSNDKGECIVQNYHEEQFLGEEEVDLEPVNYVNTCTVLSDDLISTCEPLFVTQNKEKNKEILNPTSFNQEKKEDQATNE